MEDNQGVFDIEKEYVQNVKLKRADVELLREWIENQSKYPEISGFKLLLFLHSCYYDVERTKKTINSYYQQRASWPQAFRNRDPSALTFKPHLDAFVHWPLTQTTKEGYRLMYSNIIDTDHNKYDFHEQAKLYFNVLDLYLRKAGNCEGFAFILDANGVTWGHLTKFGIFQSRKVMAYVQEALPIRLKAVHVINANPIVDKIFFIVKLFLRRELYKIIHIHSDFKSFSNYIPKSALPEDYGGEEAPIRELHATMIEALQKNSDFFVKEEEIETTKK